MELINTKDGNGNKEKDQDKGAVESIAKITITKKAENLMSGLLARVNDGFEFGRLNRHQLISWILTRFTEDCSEAEIQAIRADHFDEMALLELSLKRFKQAGSLPPELKKMLLAQAGLEASGKRPAKKAA